RRDRARGVHPVAWWRPPGQKQLGEPLTRRSPHSMPRVFISDKLGPSGLDLLKGAGLDVDYRTGLKEDALREAVQNADGMVVRSHPRATADLLENPGNLRAVVRAGVGVDNIDAAAAPRRGIIVMNTPGGNTVSTAEHTVAMMLTLARHIPFASASLQA